MSAKNFSLIEKNQVIIADTRAEAGTVEINNDRIQLKTSSEGGLLSLFAVFKTPSVFNAISFKVPSGQGQNIKVKLYFSDGNDTFQPLPAVNEIRPATENTIFLPLVRAKKVQVVFYKSAGEVINKLQITDLSFENRAEVKLSASSQEDRLWVVENLIDGRPDYGWSSKQSPRNQQELIEVDLGASFLVNEIILGSTSEKHNLFPVQLMFQISTDRKLWTTIASESECFVLSGSRYSWPFSIQRGRFIRIVIDESGRTSSNQYQSKLLSLDVRAIPENDFIETQQPIVLASSLIAGGVRLAEDTSDSPGTVVQANDRRLKKATTEASGIIQLAKDGETTSGVVVQGSDHRLKQATTASPGIIQLGRDEENREGVVVQGNDSRLQKATTEKFGIVRLAKENDTSNDTVVRGGDPRLKPATTSMFGIVKLAENNAVGAGTVVQADDQRLRLTSTSWPGIVQLAQHSESSANKALQSDDPRLNEGSEVEKGRVQFAKDNESVASKAVQSNDTRLQPATKTNAGIVRFAEHRSTLAELAVQADDPRLSDERKPTSHTHDYAEKNHPLNSHSGKLNLVIHTRVAPSGLFNKPDLNSFPLSAENHEGFAAGFSGGIYSGAENGNAIEAVSRNGSAVKAFSEAEATAIFLSTRGYAIKLPAAESGIEGSKKSLLANGEVVLADRLRLLNASNIAIAHSKFTSEVFTEGDLLSVSNEGSIEKIKSSKRQCIGVFSKNPAVILNEKKDIPDKYLSCIITGIAKIRIQGPVEAGSPVGFAGGTPGVAKALSSDLTANTAAIALETSTDTSERLVLCIIK